MTRSTLCGPSHGETECSYVSFAAVSVGLFPTADASAELRQGNAIFGRRREGSRDAAILVRGPDLVGGRITMDLSY